MKDKLTLRKKQDNLYDALEGDEDNPIIRAKIDALGFLMGDTDPITETDMQPPTTDDDIDNIITELKNDRSNVAEYSMFGDPNWKTIDAQISICEWAKGDD